jgi:transposase-like protein
VAFAGRKVTVGKPRVRSKQTGREMRLPKYERLQSGPRLGKAMMEQIALGLSMRNYEHSIESLCDGYGIKKSSVSRHFITASRRELEELLDRKLTDLDIGVVFLDGVHRGGQCVIVALGVSRDGGKHCLGLWQGATENGAVVRGSDRTRLRSQATTTLHYRWREGVVVGDPEEVSWL